MQRQVGAGIARIKGAEIVVAIFKPTNPTRVERIFDADAGLTGDRIAAQRIFKFSADSLPRFGTTSKVTFAPSARPM